MATTMDHNFDVFRKASINDVLAAMAAALVNIDIKLGELTKTETETVTDQEPAKPAKAEPEEFDLPPYEEENEAPAEAYTQPVEEPKEDKTVVDLDALREEIRGLMRKLTTKGVLEQGKKVIQSKGYKNVSGIKEADVVPIRDALQKIWEASA